MEFENLSNFSLKNSESLLLGNLLYTKIKGAIINEEDKATLFIMYPLYPETNSKGVVFTVDKNQFGIFLDKYLKICETEEEYELCREIKDLKNKVY